MTGAQVETRAVTIAADVLVAAIALALVGTVLDTIRLGDVIVALHYKTLWRLAPSLWFFCLSSRTFRDAMSLRLRASDRPLFFFLGAAALSILLGGGRWGDFRHLVTGCGVLFSARELFAAEHRRRWLLHLLGGTVVLVILRELANNPSLLPPHEFGRYVLVTANANVLGFLFAMVLPILVAEMLASVGARRWLAHLYAFAALLGILLTFSRTAAAGAAIGAATLVVLVAPRRRAFLALAAIALVFLGISRPDQWVKLRTTGDAQRIRILRTSLSIAADNPILGVGFGINNLERVFPDRYQARYGERVFRFHSMNQVVDLLVGTGIVGTACALWWAALVARSAMRRWRTMALGSGAIRAAGGVSALAAIALMSMGEPPLYHGKIVPVLFLVLASLDLDDDPRAQDAGSAAANASSGRFLRAPA